MDLTMARAAWRMFTLIWRIDRRYVIVATALMIIAGLVPISISYLFKLVIDELVRATTTGSIVTAALVGTLGLRYLLEAANDFSNTFLYSYSQRLTRYKIQDYLNMEISDKISSLDADHFENADTQDLLDKVRREAVGRIPQYTQNIFFMITYGAGLIGSIIALAPFGIWIPLLAIAASYPRYQLIHDQNKLEWGLFNRNTPERRRLGAISTMLQSKLTVSEIRTADNRDAMLERLRKMQEKELSHLTGALNGFVRKIWMPNLLEAGFVFAIAWLKLPPVLAGTLSIGSLTFLISMLDSVMSNTQRVNNQIAEIADNSRYVTNYLDLMALPPLVAEKSPGYEFETIAPPEIEFRHVSFSYPGGEDILRDISFAIAPGEHVAIVGPNGAGKTTLIKMLLRFYDPREGAILINNIDLKDIPRTHWYRFIGTLFQDFGKYPLTVKENIAFSQIEQPDEARAKEAARLSGADEFIEKFPKKYEEQLGRDFDGKELSVGQWQKVALARAFYEQAPVLVLDEPTSAIDAEAEAEIFENLGKVYRDKTVIFISHRFSTVRRADKIFVIKDGAIAERGNHESLIKKKGIYARMFRKQAEGYID